MNYLRGFAPWLCYAALSALDWRLGMCAAAAAALVLVVDQARKHNVDLLGGATCAFFVVMATIALADPKSGLHHWTSALAAATLAAVALISLAVREPFTLSIARTMVPEEFWHSKRFIHVNMVLTSAWAVAFACSAVVCSFIVRYGHSDTPALVTTQVLAFVVPFVFSNRYSGRASAGVERAAMHAAP